MPTTTIHSLNDIMTVAHDRMQAIDGEWWLALLMGDTHQVLETYVLSREPCPTRTLDTLGLITAAASVHSAQVIVVRYHSHPYDAPHPHLPRQIRALRLALKQAGIALSEIVIEDSLGVVRTLRAQAHSGVSKGSGLSAAIARPSAIMPSMLCVTLVSVLIHCV